MVIFTTFCPSHWLFSKTDIKTKAMLAGANARMQVLLQHTLTLSQTTNFSSSKLKEFADNNLKFYESRKKFFRQVENTMGKEEISPFPTVFPKGLYYRHIKTRDCLGKDCSKKVHNYVKKYVLLIQI